MLKTAKLLLNYQLLFISLISKAKVDSVTFEVEILKQLTGANMHRSPNVFQLISKLQLTPLNVRGLSFHEMMTKQLVHFSSLQTEMYKNVTRQETTPGCRICRTLIAIWVLSPLNPCQDILEVGRSIILVYLTSHL